MKKTIISLAVGTVLTAGSFAANADLVSEGATSLSITQGVGGFAPPAPGTGSWFAMEALGPGGWVYTGIGGVGGNAGDADLEITGAAQFAEAEGVDPLPGTSVANIDNPWTFFGSTGQHGSTGITATGNTLDMSGWYVSWNNVSSISMGGDAANFPVDTGIASVTCNDGNVCADGAGYSLDYAAHVPLSSANFPGVAYQLHLEGTVNAVPVPAAVWLFGSGLLGLVGVARRRKAV